MTTLDPLPISAETLSSRRAWTRALTLAERIAALRAGRLHLPDGGVPEAERRLGRWRAQAPFSEDRRWAERLAADGLAEAELLGLLAGSAPDTGEAPRWWRELEEACAFPRQDAGDAFDLDLGELAGFFAVVAPILAWKLAAVRERIAGLAAAPGPSPFDLEAAHRLILLALPERLAGAVSRTLALELNVARLEGRLRGETTAERFQSFIAELTRPGGREALFEEYPVLGRQVLHRADAWLDAGVEFLAHLKTDWPRIAETFA
ncbi:MAG TPA: hypothetical protein VII86_15720, partial [Thermoanaerobaculia bacterium]